MLQRLLINPVPAKQADGKTGSLALTLSRTVQFETLSHHRKSYVFEGTPGSGLLVKEYAKQSGRYAVSTEAVSQTGNAVE